MFRDISLSLNKSLTKDQRKTEGIFFTPKNARDLLFETLDTLSVSPISILEPSFGSGEFLHDIAEKYPTASVTGVEMNEKLFKAYIGSATVVNTDFMKYTCDDKYDLILGNPPYFVIKEKNPKCMVGRPNIFVAFLYKCLTEHLCEHGYLAFVLPTSLFNCSYYEPMRKYISTHCTIHFVKELDAKYYQTAQDTMMILLQKKKDISQKYIFKRGGTYINPFYLQLKALVAGTKTIAEMGLTVKTGDVVWNQEKEKLGNEGILLIYSNNIVDGELVLHDSSEKQYIKGFKKTPLTGKSILVPRGYGNVYKFGYVYVDLKAYYAENHVNVICGTDAGLEAVKKSFVDERTLEFIKYFVGNGAMSKTEIEQVLPIFVSC